MLFKEKQLKAIKEGRVSLAFRCWTKPTVKKGSLLHTSVGVLTILDIKEVKATAISAKDVQLAGFESKEALLQSLRQNDNGIIYRIRLAFHSEDPRIGLRSQTEISTGELQALHEKLQRLDAFSKEGAWTIKILKLIKKHPRMRAIELAGKTGFEKDWLKINIRKLKNLGLTISHETGYEIAPLGNYLLSHPSKEK